MYVKNLKITQKSIDKKRSFVFWIWFKNKELRYKFVDLERFDDILFFGYNL